MRRTLAVAGLLLAGAAGAAGPAPAAPSGPTAASPAPVAVSPLVAASRAARAARETDPGTRKVWTLEDLENLERSRPAGVNIVAMPGPSTIVSADASASAQATPRPGGVAARYTEILGQADAEIAKLERERLAGLNPLLRGLGPETQRTTPQVDAELAKWRERRAVAVHNLGGESAAGSR